MTQFLVSCILFVFCVIESQASYEQLKVGYGNLYEESVDLDVELVRGEVPTWLEGVFIRHSCGANGNTGSTSEDIDKISHSFDCIEMGQTFKFENGRVSFNNRFYETETVDIYTKDYNMNLTESGVYWRTIYADFDLDDVRKHDSNYSDTDQVIREVPHVSWWQIGDNVAAYYEYIDGADIDIHNVKVTGMYPYKDDNFGYGYGHIFIDNPAHEHQEPDGTLWSNTIVVKPLGEDQFEQWRLVYTLQNDTRVPFAELYTSNLNISMCEVGREYPIDEDRLGYMHSFGLTENYIILPETSYILKPCNVFQNGAMAYQPFFIASFEWRGDVPSKLTVIDRQTAKRVATIETEAFFTTHQLNSYERDGLIISDMLTYENSDIYEVQFMTENLISATEPYQTTVERFIINTTDWTVERKPLLPAAGYEFSNINYAYNSLPYSFAYILNNSYIDLPQSVFKLNVDTGETIVYNFPEGMYPQEPIFVASPESSAEDDGILLVQGIDGEQEKGFLVILDAKDMSELAYLSAPKLMLFGLHNKFFSLDVGHGAN